MMLHIVLEGVLFATAAGLVYGIFGGGSGLFLMPGFYFLLRHAPVAQGYEMQIAIATTASTSAVLGLLPTSVQWRKKHIDFDLVKKLFWGILTGTIFAIILLNFLESSWLKHLFGVVVFCVAVWLWFYRQESDEKTWSLSLSLHYLMTFMIGLLWFLFGVAVFVVPFLCKCGVPIRRAVGTATLVSTIFSGLAGIMLMMAAGSLKLGVSWHQIGYLNTTLLCVAVIPSSIAAFIGAKLSAKLPQAKLKKIYAGLIGVIGCLMVW